MKISRTVSEKRTYKNGEGMFVSVDHSVTREVDVPEGADPEKVSYELLLQLKREVLLPHVLDGTLTEGRFNEALTSYENLLASVTTPTATE